MSKFIYNVKFISGKAKVAALVKYIATREGVEKITLATGAESLPVTLRQKDKIEELLKMYPDSIDTFEYEDYYANPSMKNASLLISKILEDNAEKYFSSDDYIGYISNRPGVEKNIELGHGLFSSSPVLNLSETKKQIASEAKTLYTTVLSIRREDAARLGYENSDAWQKLIKKNLPHIASNFKIPLKDFKWYAAFHNEGHHPHCHMLVYSVGKSAYVNKKSISKIKSAIATDIFQDELMDLYNSQQREIELASLRTTSILTGAEELSPEGQEAISEKIVLLQKHLQNHKGRKVYGYLSKDAKAIVDDIFNVLASEPDVKEAYDRYLDFKDKQHLIYHSPATLPQHKAITEDYKFKKIKNIIIKEAAHLADSFIDEDEFLDVDLPGILPGEIESAETADLAYAKDEEPAEPEIESAETADEAHTDDFDIHNNSDESTDEMLKKFAAKIINDNFCLSFFANKADKASYYSAKKAVYRETNTERRQAALNSLIKMAINGNVYAAYDIASFLALGGILEKNEELSQEVYKRVLKTLSDKYEKSRDSYIAYRLGKMYLYGLGCDKDIAKAVEYITPAADHGNKFAQFILARIYEKGEGVEKDIEKAIKYYKMAADAGHPYAAYYMGKFYEKGNEYIKADSSLAHGYYKAAFEGFSKLAEESPSEYLFYRLGVMAMEGKGCEVDYELAINYLKKACDDFHYYPAAFKLAQIYSDASSKFYDIHQAIKYYEIAAEKDNNEHAAYRLARIYEKGEGVEKDMEKAIKYYKIASDNGHPYAAYYMGKFYEKGNEYIKADSSLAHDYYKAAFEAFLKLAEESPSEYLFYRLGVMAMEGKGCEVDYELAINYLKKACDDFNYYPAAFKLAQIYSDASSKFYDIHQAIKYYEIAAEKDNNEHAAYRLARIYEKGEGVEKDMEKAINYYKMAAEAGNSYAAYRLGCIYSDTSYEGYDFEKAYSYFKQSYEANKNEYAKRKMDRMNNNTYTYFNAYSATKYTSSTSAIHIFNSFLRLFDDSFHETDYHITHNTTDLLERIKRGERFTYE